MTTTTIGPAPSWRLIHDGASVMMLAPMQGVTSTPYSVFEAATASDCVAYAKALGLTVPEELGGLFAAPIEQLDAMPLPSLTPTEVPAYDPITHGVRAADPVLINGKWTQQWEVYPLPAEEVMVNQAAAAKALQDSIVAATQERLDSFARTRNYDGILSACTYATSNIPKFSAEGQSAVNLRDATWAALYQILEEVQAGQREAPTGFSDIEPLLPPLDWPV